MLYSDCGKLNVCTGDHAIFGFSVHYGVANEECVAFFDPNKPK